MSTTTNKRNAVKGTVAAAAGIAVLLGGAGTFALWNANGAIGSANTGTGTLTANFSKTTTWQDVTPGTTNKIDDISTFRMVPGDTIVGTTTVDVTATGENLLVDAKLDTEKANLPDNVTAEVTLHNGDDSGETLQLEGSNGDGTTYHLTAEVTLTLDQNAKESKDAAIDLQNVKIDLQQVLKGGSGA